MARPKNSRSTAMLSRKQLEDLVGKGGLVCVPKKWLKHLGFDVDQQKYATGLGYHPDGKEIWSYKDWEALKISLERESERLGQKIKSQREMIETLKKTIDWVEKGPKKPIAKKGGMTKNDEKSHAQKMSDYLNSMESYQFCLSHENALKGLLSAKEENDKKLGKLQS